MNPRDDRVRRVREMLAATGGWNARSRAALVAWARAEGLGEAEFARTLEAALGFRASPPQSPATPHPAAPIRKPTSRDGWITPSVALVGLAVSIALGRLLLDRIPRTAPRSDRAVAAIQRDPEVARTLPPPPVSFPQPPDLTGGQAPTSGLAPVEALDARPGGPLDKAALQSWRDAFVSIAEVWPSMPVERRRAVLASLAAWMAGAVSREELASMRSEMTRAIEGRPDMRQRMLASALQAMLLAEVGVSDRLSPAAAGDGAFSSGSRRGGDEALQIWASAEIPALVASLGGADARARWTGWLESVRSIERPSARGALALDAIDALLRSGSRLDSQGLAADAIGSMVRALPSDPAQPGFRDVIERMTVWLLDPRITSDRLWAFGGIWRSVAKLPDDRLLVGERDSAATRSQLAERWASLGTVKEDPGWKSLAEVLHQSMPSASAPLASRLDALSDRLTLMRRIDALAGGRDVSQVSPVPLMAQPSLRDAEQEGEARWAPQLLAPRSDVRMRALQSMRSAGVSTLGFADCAALAVRAFASASAEERQLAQQVIRESLSASTAMRLAIARELAVAADPRLALDLLQEVAGYDLPTDDVAALRADALAAILVSMPPGETLEAIASSLARLDAECALWSGSASGEEVGSVAWKVAHRLAGATAALRPLPPFDAAVIGSQSRMRRLERLAPSGPRGLAAALAVIADLEAARLAVQRPGDQQSIEAFMAALSAERARSPDAIAQASLSMDAIAWCRLTALGAPLPSRPIVTAKSPPDPVAAMKAFARAEALDAASDEQARRRRLREAVGLDPALAGPAALLMAQASADPAQRRCWVERAQALGAAIPGASGALRGSTLVLAQLLAAAEGGAMERVVAPKPGAPGRQELERFAHAQGVSLESLLHALRTPNDPTRPARIDSLREAVLHALEPAARPWLGALAAGDAEAMPEADAAQPARLLPQLD